MLSLLPVFDTKLPVIFDANGNQSSIVDMSVYSKNQNFRIVESSKFGRNNPFRVSSCVDKNIFLSTVRTIDFFFFKKLIN